MVPIEILYAYLGKLELWVNIFRMDFLNCGSLLNEYIYLQQRYDKSIEYNTVWVLHHSLSRHVWPVSVATLRCWNTSDTLPNAHTIFFFLKIHFYRKFNLIFTFSYS